MNSLNSFKIYTDTGRLSSKETERQKQRQTDREADWNTGRLSSKETDIQTDTHRQRDRNRTILSKKAHMWPVITNSVSNHILNSLFRVNLNIVLLNLTMHFTHTDWERCICDPSLQTQHLTTFLNSLFRVNLNIVLLNLTLYFTYADRKRHICDPSLQTRPLFHSSAISSGQNLSTEGENFEFFNLKYPKTLHRLWNFLVLQSHVPKNTLQKVKFLSSSISCAQKHSTEGEIS